MSESEVEPIDDLARRLLDGTEQPGPEVRRAINAVLRNKTNDPVVHAAALWLAFSAGADDLRLSRSQARGWITGFHELIQSGHVTAASYTLPGLVEAYPDVPYLDNMALVFRNLPGAPRNGRERFVDDRDADVQVIRTPGANAVVIAFCGGHHTLGIPMNLLDRWLARLGCHLVYLRDRRKIGYTQGVPALGCDMATSKRALVKLIDGLAVHRVALMGNSAGAAGALRYASAVEAERVLALSPITGGTEYAEKIIPHLPPGAVNPWGDLVPIYRNNADVRVHIVYGEKNEGDTQQSVRMSGLPGVSVEAVPDWEAHHLIHGLLRADRLEAVLQWMVSDEDAFAADSPSAKAELFKSG